MILRNHITKSSSFLLLLLVFSKTNIYSQGLNHNFLIGYSTGVDTNVVSKRGWLKFDNNSVTVVPDNFNMAFRAGQGNISDNNGNLLMVSNGCYIMNANGSIMMNGSGLNPNSFTNDWCTSISGIPYVHSNIILPWPDDSTKYILFHQTGNYNINNSSSTELYYTIIDMTLDNGMGGVTQKNIIAVQDTLNPGMAACKHANGRDWWIIIFREYSDIIYKVLLTPQGVTSISSQSLGFPPHDLYNGQPQFSPDGKKFAYRWYTGTWGNFDNWVRLFDFDRCSGNFSNGISIDFWEANPGLGLSFSPNSKYLYVSTLDKIFQINTDTTNVPASLQTVAINDGYCFPFNFTCTDFWVMYLAANGKIYISSGNGVVDMHYINYPDSSGILCDVQQHALSLPCWSGRGNVYHPNYYLGCDTSCTPCLVSVNENGGHDFKFNIYPNPSSGNFNIIYLLPQNKEGKLEIYDVTGKIVYEMRLPQWSTLQHISSPQNNHIGIYSAIIRSENSISTKKLILLRE